MFDTYNVGSSTIYPIPRYKVTIDMHGLQSFLKQSVATQ